MRRVCISKHKQRLADLNREINKFKPICPTNIHYTDLDRLKVERTILTEIKCDKTSNFKSLEANFKNCLDDRSMLKKIKIKGKFLFKLIFLT